LSRIFRGHAIGVALFEGDFEWDGLDDLSLWAAGRTMTEQQWVAGTCSAASPSGKGESDGPGVEH